MTEQSPITQTIRIAVAQLNPTVGDVAGNLAKAREARAEAAREGAHLLLLTELFISGYPPEDLVLKPAFIRACWKAVENLAADTADGGPGVVVGFPRQDDTGRYNSVAVLDGGKVIFIRDKVDLPNYGEFDEKRVFDEGTIAGPVNFRGVRIGIPICEEIWNDLGICETLAESGAEILLVPNGSPYYRGKVDVRHQVALRQVIESGLPLIFAAQVGGQDELRGQRRQVAGFPDEPVRNRVGGDDLEEERQRLALHRRSDGSYPGRRGGRLPRLPAGLPRLRE
jgi:NAD+ synthase